MGFTVVGIALDMEGIGPAKLYYERFGVTFPALVDANYATGFGAVPKTFFVNEHGVVQPLENWQQRLRPKDQLAPVTDAIRRQWSDPAARLESSEVARLAETHAADPLDLQVAVDLASRYLDLNLATEAAGVLRDVMSAYQPKKVAQHGGADQKRLLAQAYFQMARACGANRKEQEKYATMSFYLRPTVGYGKQIARLIAPEKFDGRPNGDFDNSFREGTLRRLRKQRQDWLSATQESLRKE